MGLAAKTIRGHGNIVFVPGMLADGRTLEACNLASKRTVAGHIVVPSSVCPHSDALMPPMQPREMSLKIAPLGLRPPQNGSKISPFTQRRIQSPARLEIVRPAGGANGSRVTKCGLSDCYY